MHFSLHSAPTNRVNSGNIFSAGLGGICLHSPHAHYSLSRFAVILISLHKVCSVALRRHMRKCAYARMFYDHSVAGKSFLPTYSSTKISNIWRPQNSLTPPVTVIFMPPISTVVTVWPTGNPPLPLSADVICEWPHRQHEGDDKWWVQRSRLSG